MSVDGLREVEIRLRRELERIEEITEKGIQEITFDLLGRAIQLAPVDTGDLRGSGQAVFQGLTGEVSFNTPYALRQHEELEYNHPNGGQAKYLQQPFEENVDNYIEHLRNKLRGGVD